MLSLSVTPTAVKSFMGSLLRETHFDHFLIRNIELTLTTHISISGLIETEDAEAKKSYISWGTIRSLVFDLIKRGDKPKLLKIVFSHPTPEDVHENAAALFLNMTYEKDSVSFITATAQQSFSLEKSLNSTWDEFVKSFFINIKLPVINNLITDEEA